MADQYIAAAALEILETTNTQRNRWTAASLLKTEFPPLPWFVDGLITSGLSLLWGSPKSGKSIAVLHLLTAIAAGGRALGSLEVQQSECALISLEDGPRRIQKRLQLAGTPALQNLHIFTDWATGQKGLEWLEKFLDKEPGVRVIAIDTFGLFARTKDANDYGETTAKMSEIKSIADDRDVGIVMVHHSRKTTAVQGDMIETALGSTGIVAGPDHLIYLQRTPEGQSDGVLHFTSKDADSQQLALNFDPDIGGWVYAGDARELQATKERQEIFDLLSDSDEPMSPKGIAKALQRNHSTVKTLLRKMSDAGTVVSLSGLYRPVKPVDSVDRVDRETTQQPSGSTESIESTPFTPNSDDLEIF